MSRPMDHVEGHRMALLRPTVSIRCVVCGIVTRRRADALYCGTPCKLKAYRARRALDPTAMLGRPRGRPKKQALP